MTLSKQFRDVFMPRMRDLIQNETTRMAQKGGVVKTNDGWKLCDDLANDRVSQWMKATMEGSSAAQSRKAVPQVVARKSGEHGVTACTSPRPNNFPTCQHRKRSSLSKASEHLASQVLRRRPRLSPRFHPRPLLRYQLEPPTILHPRTASQCRFLRQLQLLCR